MKLLAIFSFLFVFTSLVKAQSSTIVNDTIYPYGDYQSQFYHVFKHDSTYIVEGYVTGQNNSPPRKFFLKLGANGNIIKRKQYSSSWIFDGGKYYNKVIETQFGFVNATTFRDTSNFHCLIMAIDYNLDTIWTKRYSPNSFSPNAKGSVFFDIKLTPDKGYLATGFYELINSSYTSYPFLMKIDSIGNIQWIKKFETYEYKSVHFRRLELTPDMGVLLLTNKNRGTVIKTTALGNIQWETNIPNDSVYTDDGDIAYMGANNYIIACPYMYEYIPSTPHSGYIYEGLSIISINYLTGQVNWEKKHRPFRSLHFYPTIQLNTFNNQFAISATAENIYNPIPNTNYQYREHGAILYYNANGDSIGANLYLSQDQVNSWLNYVLFEPNGSITGVGFASALNNYHGAAWFFRTNDYLYLGVNDPLKENVISSCIKVFPNPATNRVHIDLAKAQSGQINILSITGKLLLSKNINNKTLISIDVKELSSGIYIVQFLPTNSDKMQYSKIIIQP